jgi:monoamine oxidase
MDMTDTRVDVAIVGAGLAGLNAARVLRRAGRSVVVLEARDRVGGRVWSRSTAGAQIDLGAQWIGPGQRRMAALARELDLRTLDTHAKGKVVVERDGVIRRPPLPMPHGVPAILDAIQLAIRLDLVARRVGVEMPWMDGDARTLDTMSCERWLEERAYTRRGRVFWRALTEAVLCTTIDRVSALELAQQIATMGGIRRLFTAEHTFFARGAQAVAEGLAAPLGDALRLGVPVTAIRHDGAAVRVTTAAGEVEAGRVVVAVPPQLVAQIAFDPPIERPPPDAIVRGVVVKSIAIWDHAWWRDTGASGMALAYDGPIGVLMDGSGPDGRPGVLVALASAGHAAHLASLALPDRQWVVLTAVERLLGPTRAPLLDFVSTDWTGETWSLGGYAARRTTGTWTRHGGALSRPQGRIHFAGTETATAWRSYMEGAVQSGERAGAEVLAALSR